MITVTIFEKDGRKIAHPDNDTSMCEIFHALGQKCICESWRAILEGVELIDSWYAHSTGEALTDGMRYYEIFNADPEHTTPGERWYR